MYYENINYNKTGGIATISLNRPSVLNALSHELIIELNKAATDAADDDEVHILVVKGEGKSFSAGIDLKKLNETIQGGQFTEEDILDDGNEFINQLQSLGKVTIAQVHGYCFTGAMELMLAFDLVIAADDAQIGDTHCKWGIQPRWGMSQRLARKVGLSKAMELSFTAKTITGKEAERIGLVNRAVPLDSLDDHVLKLANDIMKNSPQTIAAMKSLYYEGFNTTLGEGMEIENRAKFNITDRIDILSGFGK